MIAKETNYPPELNEVVVSNFSSPYVLQQWKKLISVRVANKHGSSDIDM